MLRGRAGLKGPHLPKARGPFGVSEDVIDLPSTALPGHDGTFKHVSRQ